MVSYYVNMVQPDHYQKIQHSDHRFNYKSGKILSAERLDVERPVFCDGRISSEEVQYRSKSYVSNVGNRIRITTCDLIGCIESPRFYNCFAITYEELDYEDYNRLKYFLYARRFSPKYLTLTFDESTEYAVVFFHLGTGGFSFEDDILQISMRSGVCMFDYYVDPSKRVRQEASGVNHLSAVVQPGKSGELYYNGRLVQSFPLELVLLKLLYFLKKLNRKCILVAHNNLSFHMPRLVRAMAQFGLLREFEKVIEGYYCTYRALKVRYGDQPKGFYHLGELARLFGIACSDIHDSTNNAAVVKKLTEVGLDMDEIGVHYIPFECSTSNLDNVVDL